MNPVSFSDWNVMQRGLHWLTLFIYFSLVIEFASSDESQRDVVNVMLTEAGRGIQKIDEHDNRR